MNADSPLIYRIEATLNYLSGVATVRERVGYTNLTGSTLSSIAFNVTPRHFDAFTLTALSIDGRPTQAKQSNVTLEAPLPIMQENQNARLPLDRSRLEPSAGDLIGVPAAP